MNEHRRKSGAYEDWNAVMRMLLHGDPEQKQIAFLKLNRLISGFLVSLQAWNSHDHWEDLQQTVLMKLVKSFCQGQLREAQAFVVYARTITRNEFFDFLKARGVQREGEEEIPDVPELVSLDKETVLVVRSAFSHLPEEQRRAIQAVYLEGHTYEEAAETTGIPLGSLKRYLRLGLGQLRLQLADVLKGQ